MITDPASLAELDVLNRLSSPAQYTDLNLYTLVVCQMLRLTLDRGNSDASAVAYGRLGMIAGLRSASTSARTASGNSLVSSSSSVDYGVSRRVCT